MKTVVGSSAAVSEAKADCLTAFLVETARHRAQGGTRGVAQYLAAGIQSRDLRGPGVGTGSWDMVPCSSKEQTNGVGRGFTGSPMNRGVVPQRTHIHTQMTH